MKDHQFDIKRLDAQIMEAERLVVYINNRPDGDAEKTGAIIRWAIVSDEATTMIQIAEETLEAIPLEAARRAFNVAHPGLWDVYKQNPRRFKQITGQDFV